MKANPKDINYLLDNKTDQQWHLIGFYNKCEAEVMVAQTIFAANVNYKKHGEAYSIKGNVYSTSGNTEAYNMLVNDGMFVEEKRQGKTVIFPTDALIDKLYKHFEMERPK